MTGGEDRQERSLASASRILAASMLAASAANYVLNIVLVRWLDLASFGDASLMVTLMLGLTSLAVGLQLVTVTWTVGQSDEAKAIAARRLRRFGFALGVASGASMAATAPWLAALLNTQSSNLFVFLGVGLGPFFVVAVDRGLLQSNLRFGDLAATYVVEAAVRLGVALALVHAGLGATGATIGLAASFVGTWAFTARRTEPVARHRSGASSPASSAGVLPVAVLLAGQVLINNGDVILSKAILSAESAGGFAAVALIGRAVFFASWAVLQAVFPAAVASDGHDRSLTRAALAIVAGVNVAALVVLAVGATFIGSILFGNAVGDARLLFPYALATSLFALANVLATIDVARGSAKLAAMIVVGAVTQTIGMMLFATDSASLINVQIAVMAALAVAVAGASRDLWAKPSTQRRPELAANTRAPVHS